MATRAKDAATVKKEKKPIAASSSQAQRRGNPKPGSSSAAATSPAKKPTSNYLRPTLGSKTECPTRKSTTTSASNEDKARLLRRRSLDRPSSLSRQDSSGTNKDAAAAASRLRTTSSLKSTGNSSNRVASGVHKPGGSRSVNPAVKSQVPLRRSSSSSLYKNGTSSAHVPSTTSPTKANKAGLGPDPDNKLGETIEEGLVCSDAEAEMVHPDELEEFHKEQLESEVVGSAVGNAKPSESEDSSPHEVVVEEDENLPANENNEAEDSSPDEVRVSDQENVIDGQDLEPAAEEVQQEQEGSCDEETGGDQVDPSKEDGGQEKVANQVAKEAEALLQQSASMQKRVVVQGKKESPSAYNDVIEETKNKLLEARKNKVKALVGAFETVIDYESGSK